MTMTKEEETQINLVVTPINPLTPRQAEVLRALVSGITSDEALSDKLDIERSTAHNYIYGTDTASGASNKHANRKKLGLLGTIERKYGIRPGNRAHLIAILLGDIVMFGPPEPNPFIEEGTINAPDLKTRLRSLAAPSFLTSQEE